MGVVSSFYLNLYWKNKAAKIDGEALNARLSRKKPGPWFLSRAT